MTPEVAPDSDPATSEELLTEAAPFAKAAEVNELPNIFESAMLIAFGLAWPANILNSLRVKSSRGRAPAFLWIVSAGYVFGLTAKFLGPGFTYVAVFYLINLGMVSFDLFLYYRYRRKDRAEERAD